MKRAFTMIELVFVIVILGIISAIAVPKLAATREDAQFVKLKTDFLTIIKDMKAYYAVNGEFKEEIKSGAWFDNMRKITNVSGNYQLYNNVNISFGFDNRWCISFYAITAKSNVGADAIKIRGSGPCYREVPLFKKLLNDPAIASTFTDSKSNKSLKDVIINSTRFDDVNIILDD